MSDPVAAIRGQLAEIERLQARNDLVETVVLEIMQALESALAKLSGGVIVPVREKLELPVGLQTAPPPADGNGADLSGADDLGNGRWV